MGYTRKQKVTLVVFCVAQFCNAVCISLQAPFYPSEAEGKGATATEYGLVFGVYELTVFIISPIYGQYLYKFGVKLVNNAGIFTVSVMSICFGFLNYIEDSTTFIALSFVVRIVEALGSAAFVTAAFSIIAKEFPENVGSAFAALETCFGIGLIVGPTVGGALYEVGGFTLPFVALGGVLLLAALLVYCLLPSQDSDSRKTLHSSGTQLLRALRLPSVLLASATVAAGSISIGFLQATLEPHLQPLGLTPVQMGLMFVLNGATYAISAPIWGWLCDKCFSPRITTAIGSAIVVIAFTLVGPAPFISSETTLTLSICALVLHGLGFGAELVATFTGLHRDSLQHGFTDDLSTYGLVSGIWASAFALGCFIGPTMAGILYDTIGFAWATMVVAAIHLLVFIVTALYLCSERRNRCGIYTQARRSLCQDTEERAVLFKKDEGDSTYGSASTSSDEDKQAPAGCVHIY